jgi:hypothetical protein
VLVSTDPASSAEPGPDYVYIDWGPEFFATHNVTFPDFAGPALSANVGWIGLQYILKNGGSGYFPLRLIRQDLKSGRLTRLTDAPEFTLPAYAVYPAEGDPDLFGAALSLMHELAAAEIAPTEWGGSSQTQTSRKFKLLTFSGERHTRSIRPADVCIHGQVSQNTMPIAVMPAATAASGRSI